jgi:hypothetical protein
MEAQVMFFESFSREMNKLAAEFGHRTSEAGFHSMIQSGKIVSGLEAALTDKLDTFESGYVAGQREPIKALNLSSEELLLLDVTTESDSPIARSDVLRSIAEERGVSEQQVAFSHLKSRYREALDRLRGIHLERGGEHADIARAKSYGISKLTPYIFANKGGLMPTDRGYGEFGILFNSKKFSNSGKWNTVPNEHISLPDYKNRKLPHVPLGRATFVVPDNRLDEIQAMYPERRIVPESSVGDRILSEESPLSARYWLRAKKTVGRLLSGSGIGSEYFDRKMKAE